MIRGGWYGGQGIVIPPFSVLACYLSGSLQKMLFVVRVTLMKLCKSKSIAGES
jgi:hypothetical protein